MFSCSKYSQINHTLKKSVFKTTHKAFKDTIVNQALLCLYVCRVTWNIVYSPFIPFISFSSEGWWRGHPKLFNYLGSQSCYCSLYSHHYLSDHIYLQKQRKLHRRSSSIQVQIGFVEVVFNPGRGNLNIGRLQSRQRKLHRRSSSIQVEET